MVGAVTSVWVGVARLEQEEEEERGSSAKLTGSTSSTQLSQQDAGRNGKGSDGNQETPQHR